MDNRCTFHTWPYLALIVNMVHAYWNSAPFDAIEANPVSSTWRVSGNLDVSQPRVVYYLLSFEKSTWSYWLVPQLPKYCKTFDSSSYSRWYTWIPSYCSMKIKGSLVWYHFFFAFVAYFSFFFYMVKKTPVIFIHSIFDRTVCQSIILWGRGCNSWSKPKLTPRETNRWLGLIEHVNSEVVWDMKVIKGCGIVWPVKCSPQASQYIFRTQIY